EDHAGFAQPTVDVRVVDDLAREVDLLVRELLARLIGVLDCALDSVTEAELARQSNRHAARAEGEVALLEQIDQTPVVRRRELLLHVSLEAEAFAEVGGRGSRRRHALKFSGRRYSNGRSTILTTRRIGGRPDDAKPRAELVVGRTTPNHAPNWWSCVGRGFFRAWPRYVQSNLDFRRIYPHHPPSPHP